MRFVQCFVKPAWFNARMLGSLRQGRGKQCCQTVYAASEQAPLNAGAVTLKPLNSSKKWESLDQDAKDILESLLHDLPERRLTATQLLHNPWLYAAQGKLFPTEPIFAPVIPPVPLHISHNIQWCQRHAQLLPVIVDPFRAHVDIQAWQPKQHMAGQQAGPHSPGHAGQAQGLHPCPHPAASGPAISGSAARKLCDPLVAQADSLAAAAAAAYDPVSADNRFDSLAHGNPSTAAAAAPLSFYAAVPKPKPLLGLPDAPLYPYSVVPKRPSDMHARQPVHGSVARYPSAAAADVPHSFYTAVPKPQPLLGLPDASLYPYSVVPKRPEATNVRNLFLAPAARFPSGTSAHGQSVCAHSESLPGSQSMPSSNLLTGSTSQSLRSASESMTGSTSQTRSESLRSASESMTGSTSQSQSELLYSASESMNGSTSQTQSESLRSASESMTGSTSQTQSESLRSASESMTGSTSQSWSESLRSASESMTGSTSQSESASLRSASGYRSSVTHSSSESFARSEDSSCISGDDSRGSTSADSGLLDVESSHEMRSDTEVDSVAESVGSCRHFCPIEGDTDGSLRRNSSFNAFPHAHHHSFLDRTSASPLAETTKPEVTDQLFFPSTFVPACCTSLLHCSLCSVGDCIRTTPCAAFLLGQHGGLVQIISHVGGAYRLHQTLMLLLLLSSLFFLHHFPRGNLHVIPLVSITL